MTPKDGEMGETPSTQRLMPDSGSPDAEQPMQPLFRKTSIFSYLAIALSVMAFHVWARSIPSRQDRSDALAAVHFTRVRFDPGNFAPLRLAGVWAVAIADPRFGGVSAMAIDGGDLLALTDSGTVIRFPRPGQSGTAVLHDLGDGPGSASFKSNRDSEALARDAAGRGWWVAFENWQQLWLYDSQFRAALQKIDLGEKRWRDNRGVEGMIADGDSLLLFPELGGEWLRVSAGTVVTQRLINRFGSISDATRLADGRVLLVTRKLGLKGLAKHLVVAEKRKGRALTLRDLGPLGLGATDNVEAIAAEPHAGGTRLWLMTDNDFRPRAPTYLVALDLP